MIGRPIFVAAAAAVLSPATGVGLQLTLDYVAIRPFLPPELWRTWVSGTVSGFFILGAVPAAILSALGYLTFLVFRARGFSARALLVGAAVLGAACCLFVANAVFWRPAGVDIGGYCDAEWRCVGSARRLLRLARSRHRRRDVSERGDQGAKEEASPRSLAARSR